MISTPISPGGAVEMPGVPNCVVTLAAYNEEDNVAPVVRDIVEMGYLCILVDDGSDDATAAAASKAGAIVVRHVRNLGQGDAVLTGFRAALMVKECEVIIEMDADGQHAPSEIPLFLEEMRKTDMDIVVGSRILGAAQANADFLRTAFLPHYTRLINILTGYSMTDALCGFRGFRRVSMEPIATKLDRMLEPQYLAAEMFVRFSHAGMKVSEVPIHLKPRSSGFSRKGVLRFGFGILKAIVRALFDVRVNSK